MLLRGCCCGGMRHGGAPHDGQRRRCSAGGGGWGLLAGRRWRAPPRCPQADARRRGASEGVLARLAANGRSVRDDATSFVCRGNCAFEGADAAVSLATGRAWCCSVPRGPRAALRPAGQSHTYAMARWRTTTTSGQDGVRGELKADPSACHDGFPELASAFAAPRPAVGARRVLLLALWMGLVHANIVAVLLAIGSVAWYSRAGAAAPAVDVYFGGECRALDELEGEWLGC